MKIFRTENYVKMKNPDPGKPYRPEVLTREDQARNLGGLFGLLEPGNQVPYHYHANRESVIIVLSGEATEILDGKKITLKAGDMIYIAPGERHGTVNRGERDFRYLEFFTCPPVESDFIEVKE